MFELMRACACAQARFSFFSKIGYTIKKYFKIIKKMSESWQDCFLREVIAVLTSVRTPVCTTCKLVCPPDFVVVTAYELLQTVGGDVWARLLALLDTSIVSSRVERSSC